MKNRTPITLLSVITSIFLALAPRPAAAESTPPEGDISPEHSISNVESPGVGPDADIPTTGSTSEAEEGDQRGVLDRISLNYFGIFYGPSIGNPTSYQPRSDGTPDYDRPVIVKNFASLYYDFGNGWDMSGTAYWIWQPVLGGDVAVRDPYLRIGKDRIIDAGAFHVYADARVHFAISDYSRENDVLTSLQTFQIWSYDAPESRFTFGAYTSQRLYVLGSQGWGNDLELYFGPHLNFRASSKLSFSVLYEMAWSHFYGDRAFQFSNDGTDIEPGFTWNISRSLSVNPYLTVYLGNRVNLDSTAFGMTLSWTPI